MADFDRGLFGGNDPADLLHTLLGTGIAAQVLSVVYYAFFFSLCRSRSHSPWCSPPARRAASSTRSPCRSTGPWAPRATTCSPPWDRIYAAPAGFADLPATETSHLQDVLLRQRLGFLTDPAAADAHQGIAAFGSLHTSIIFTAAVAAHMLGLGRRLRIGLWVLFALTAIATVYLGWHYVVDDLAGVVIGLTALALARGLTGFEPRTARRLRIPRQAGMALPRAAAESGQHTTGARALDEPFAGTASGSDAA